MDKKIILGILVIAAAFFFTSPYAGSFVLISPDSYYTHVLHAPQSVAYGQPIEMSVSLSEINRQITDCDRNGMGNRLSPSSVDYCRSFTYFNARSIRVNVDGMEQINFYYYPNNVAPNMVSGLPLIGVAFCMGGNCNQNPSPQQSAYWFGTNVEWQHSLDGQTLMRLSIPQYLSVGTHTIDVYYYSETVSHSGESGFPPMYWANEGGAARQINREMNAEHNYIQRFSINVTRANASCAGQVEDGICSIPRIPNSQCAVGQMSNTQECSYYIDAIVDEQPPTGIGSPLTWIIVGILGAIVILKIILKK